MSQLAINLIKKCIETQDTHLDLGNCGLWDQDVAEGSEIDRLLRQCTHIETLIWSSNWEEWTDENGWQRKNSQNKGSKNFFTTHPPALSSLPRVRRLVLGGSFGKRWEISGMDFLAALTRLEHVWMAHNQINELKGLEGLTGLKSLDLWNNEIGELKGLEGLTGLKNLNLNINQISEIKGLEGLTGLNSLYLSYNQISDLKPLLPFINRTVQPLQIDFEQYLMPEGSINLYSNPITTPPLELAQQGNAAIIRFFNQDLETAYQAKLLIVGEPGAGKTSLMKKMENPQYPIPSAEDSTIGVQVLQCEWQTDQQPQALRVNIWDFGGQEMQYLTHQFFLSSDALYLLLTSARKDFDNLDYWFNIIALLGKNENNENSELVVVANEHNMQQGQLVKTFDQVKYQQQYPHLPFSYQPVNLATAADGDGRFYTLMNTVKEKLAGLKVIGRQLPVKWGVVRERFAQSGAHYLPITEYFTECKKAGIGEALALDLATYLHKIGDAVFFAGDHAVNQFIILNPKWALDGVYAILKTPAIADSGGHFTGQQVQQLLAANYSFIERNMILALMTKDSFEVAYKIPGRSDDYIAPQLLPLVQPDVPWQRAGALHFQYHYPFMPKGIITRLIVRLHDAIYYKDGRGLVWRTGVFFQQHGCTARVEEIKKPDTGQQVIAIEIQGPAGNRKLLLYDICRTIEGIHRDSFANITCYRQIPCNCAHCRVLPEPHFYDYNVLMDYLNEDISHIRCDKKVKNQPAVKDLLQGIFDIDLTGIFLVQTHLELLNPMRQAIQNDPFEVNRPQPVKKKIFISYSRKDSAIQFKNGVKLNIVAELQTHLKQLERQGIASVWLDTNLLAGDQWDAAIKRQLAEADIILFLVSAHLVATDYVWHEEMPLAQYHRNHGHTKIVPIIVRPCQWTHVPLFSEHNALPAKGTPVTSFNDFDEPLNEIAGKIAALCRQSS